MEGLQAFNFFWALAVLICIFLLQVAICRWIFKVNTIVDLLTQQNELLQRIAEPERETENI
jgi:TM2 domain-containing membrane protein YozV